MFIYLFTITTYLSRAASSDLFNKLYIVSLYSENGLKVLSVEAEMFIITFSVFDYE